MIQCNRLVVLTLVFLFSIVQALKAQTWEGVGSAISTGSTENSTIFFDGTTPYVVYRDNSVSNKATVKKFNGTAWETVGTEGFSSGDAGYITAAFSGSVPYVAYLDGANGNRATVKKFNGTAWEDIGTAGFSAGWAEFTSIALEGTTPYVAYKDGGNGNKATVKRFNGTSWEDVGAAGFSAGNIEVISLVFNGTTPYVVYRDVTDGNKATVMRFNGTAWVAVGSAGFSAGGVESVSMAFKGTVPYVTYKDGGNSNKVTVMKFNGTAWETVGSAGFSAGQADFTTIVFNGTTSYVTYRDGGSSNKATVMKFNGSTWEAVGSAGFSASAADYTFIGSDGAGKLYVVYNSSGQAFAVRTAVPPGPGKALAFTRSSSQKITVNNTLGNFGTGNFTIEAWIKTGAVAGAQSIITKRSNCDLTTFYSLVVNNTGKLFLEISGGSGDTYTAITGTTTVTDSKWHHVASVRNGSSFTLYIDGKVEEAKGITGYPDMTSTDPFLIGGINCASNFFNGSIDEVRVYNAALTQASILFDMTHTTSSVPANLQAYYNFDAGSGTALTDLSGNSNHGTLVNGPSWVESYAMVVPSANYASGITATDLTASWTEPLEGSITNYLLDVAINATFASPVSGSPFTVSGSSQTITGLSTGTTTYYYRVRADKTSVSGQGAYSATIIAPAVAPTAITSTKAGSIMATSANLIGAVSSDGGSPVTGKGVVYSLSPNPTIGAGTQITDGTGSGLIQGSAAGLTANTTYYYRAYAINSVNTAYGSNVSFLTATNAPSTPVASSQAINSFLLSWTAVTGATSYRLDVSAVSNFASFVSGYNDLTVNATSRSVTGLAANTTYYFRLRAVNSGAISDNSASGSQATNAYSPVAGFGNALDFDGTNDYVSVPHSSSLTPTAGITMEAWIYTSSLGSHRFIIGKETAIPQVRHYLFSVDPTRNLGAYLSFTSGQWIYYGAPSVQIPANIWTHVAVSYDNSMIRFYMNGAQIDSTLVNKQLATTGSAPVTLGSRGDDYYFNGKIDEIQIWGRALTTQEISTSMYRNNTTSGLAAYWKFNESTGTSIADSSPNMNNGTMTNMDNADHVLNTLSDFTINEDASAYTGILPGSDRNGNALTYAVVSNGAKGTAALTNASTGAFTYTPIANANGSDSFTYKTNNGAGDSNTATINVSIAAVNDDVPVLTSTAAAAITTTTADLGGNITFGGDAAVTDRGIVWSTTANPTIADNKVANGSGMGTFTATINPPFLGNTSYHYRAYATNSIGTGYGSDISFTTTPVAPASPVASSVTSSGFSLNWTAVTGASSYKLDISVLNDFSNFVTGYNDLTVTGTSQSLSGLSPGTVYYFRIRAVNTSGASSNSVTGSQSTLSNDASLLAIALSTGTLSPAFSGATTAYTASVPNATTSITLTPTRNEGTATIKINTVTVASGTASGALTLNVGANTITTVVTAGDGITTKTYTVTVTREGSDNANLSVLSTTAGTISPIFTSLTTSYAVTVPFTMTSVTVTPTVDQANATVKVNGMAVSSSSASEAISLSVGANIINTLVIAQDGTTTKTYTLAITRTAASTNANLSALSTAAGTIFPAFSSLTTSYVVSVPNSTASVTITPTVDQANATVKVNGITVTSAVASGTINLSVGANTITILVTAQDGTTSKYYTITVTRASGVSSVADLSGLTLSNGILNTTFALGTITYTATVPFSSNSITLTPTVEQANAIVRVNGTTVSSTAASGAISLNVGSNTITTMVTAQDGITTKTYTVTVTRTAPATIANLNALSVSAGTLSPAFTASTTSYELYVNNSVSSTTVTASRDNAGASIKVNGTTIQTQTPSGAINLAAGANTITVLVTAEDGITTKTYIVKITRLAAEQTLTDQSGGATVNNTVKEVVVTSQTQPVTVTIPQGTTTTPKVDYSNIVAGGSGTVPQTTITSPLAKVEIPAATTITGSNTTWTGTISAPKISDYTFPEVKGQIITKGLVIEVGDPNVSLTFTKAVRLILYGQAGMRVARVHAGVYEEITTVGPSDTQSAGDALTANGSFKINVGADLVIWTKGFSQFITFTQSVNLDDAVAAADLATLTLASIVGTSGTSTSVTGPLTLPSIGPNGSTITWASNNTAVISNDGKTVTRPVFGSGNATVTITGTVTKGTSFETVTITLTVLELPNQAPTLNAFANVTPVCYTTAIQTVNLAGISAGPESGQTVAVTASSSNAGLLSSLTIVGTGASRTLTFTPASAAGGTTTITVTVKDNGGTADGGSDTFTQTFTVTVNPLPVVVINSNLGTSISKGLATVLTATGGTTYSWASAAGIVSGQNTATLTVRPAVSTTYTVSATSATGCTTVQAITITVNEDYISLDATNIMTPNGDGKNDALVIRNIDMYPNNTLKIFDRSGRIVFQKKTYTNDWAGTGNGMPLEEDTYFWVLDFGNGIGNLKGYVSIVRGAK